MFILYLPTRLAQSKVGALVELDRSTRAWRLLCARAGRTRLGEREGEGERARARTRAEVKRRERNDKCDLHASVSQSGFNPHKLGRQLGPVRQRLPRLARLKSCVASGAQITITLGSLGRLGCRNQSPPLRHAGGRGRAGSRPAGSVDGQPAGRAENRSSG